MLAQQKRDEAKMQEGKSRPPKAARDVKAAPKHNSVWQSLALRPSAIQPKLAISQPGDFEERGINNIAERVTIDGGRVRSPQPEGIGNTTRSVGDKNQRIHEAARHGTSGTGGPLPFLERIQKPFGRHDVSRIVAHTDGAAKAGSRAMGAKAFTIGNHVAFGGNPDLQTAAHEAAHAVQQRGGLSLSGAIGEAGDNYEQHADAVAELIMHGNSAESLLDKYAAHSSRDVKATGESAAGGRYESSASFSDRGVPGRSLQPAPAETEGNHSHGSVQLLELSYDDGPDANTRLTLDALHKGGAKATFYLVGQKVQAGDNWRIVFDLAAAGNWLGNHAFDWNDAKDDHIFMKGTPSERAAKILQTEFAIRDALIKGKADAQANKKWDAIPAPNRAYIDDVIATGTGRFRTPGFKSHWYSEGGGNQKAGIELASQAMEAAGLRRFAVSDSVSVDPKDWEKGKTQADVEKAVIGGLSSDSDSILLHSRLRNSAAATPAILDAIKKKGFTYQAPARGSTTGAKGGGFADVGTSAEWVDSFAAIGQIGPATTVNKTDPIDRTVTTQTGVAWLDYGDGQYLAVIFIENSSIERGTKILFLSFVHTDLKDKAITRATPHQPRGIQTIARQNILFVPTTPTASAAKK